MYNTYEANTHNVKLLQVHGWSVLHIAANSGQGDVVGVILELSSDVDITLKDKVRHSFNAMASKVS